MRKTDSPILFGLNNRGLAAWLVIRPFCVANRAKSDARAISYALSVSVPCTGPANTP